MIVVIKITTFWNREGQLKNIFLNEKISKEKLSSSTSIIFLVQHKPLSYNCVISIT